MSHMQDQTISVMDTDPILQPGAEMELLPEELAPSQDRDSSPTTSISTTTTFTATPTTGTTANGQGSANATETLRDNDSDISQSQVLKDHVPFYSSMPSSSPTFSSPLSSLSLTPLPSSFFPSNPASPSFLSSLPAATTIVPAPLPPSFDSYPKAEPTTGLAPTHFSTAKPDRLVPRHKPEYKSEHTEHTEHKARTFASQHSLLLGQCHYPFRFLVITPFRLCHDSALKTERCAFYHLGFVFDSLRTVSFQSLIVAYSLPLLCVFTPGLVLPLSLFQLLRVIAAAGLDQEKAGSLKHMESSSSSSSHHRDQATPGTSSGRSNHNHNHTHTHTHAHSNSDSNNNNTTHNHPSQSHPYQYQSYQSSQAHFSRNSQHDLMFDRDDDDQSDGSEGEGDPGFEEIEYWIQRCSICFDSRLDFCLEYCRDQFCRDCFQR